MKYEYRLAGPFLLLRHDTYPLCVRQFVNGAVAASKDGGITVIIDNFRASNTILALLKYTDHVIPVQKVKEAMALEDHIKIGEDLRNYDHFDYDNSPVIIEENGELLRDKKIVIRTSNGTQGLINAMGSKEILVGAFRNISVVVDYCLQKIHEGIPVSFVAMGSGDIARIEDIFGAKMMYYRILDKMGDKGYHNEDNPWLGDWVAQIRESRSFEEPQRADREYCIKLDQTQMLPRFNQVTKRLELIN